MSYYGPPRGNSGRSGRNSGGGRNGGGRGWGNRDGGWNHHRRDVDQRRDIGNRIGSRDHKKARGQNDYDRKGDGGRDRGGYNDRDQNGRSTQQEPSHLRQERNQGYPYKDITRRDFLKLSKEQQIMAMYPDLGPLDSIEGLRGRFRPLEILNLKEEPLNRTERKDMAADAAVEIVVKAMEDMRPEDESESDGSSEDDGWKILGNKPLEYDPQYVRNFFEALKHNHIFDCTFHDPCVLDRQDFCYCPCCQKMHKWRDIFSVDVIKSGDVCSGKGMQPSALMDHLEKISGIHKQVPTTGFLHLGTVVYLRKLWGDLRGEGIGHKALYKPGDADFKRAERAQVKFYLDRQIEMDKDRDNRIKELEEALEEKDRQVKMVEDRDNRIGELERELERCKKELEEYEEEKRRIERVSDEISPSTCDVAEVQNKKSMSSEEERSARSTRQDTRRCAWWPRCEKFPAECKGFNYRGCEDFGIDADTDTQVKNEAKKIELRNKEKAERQAIWRKEKKAKREAGLLNENK